jgi:hypothetical protein
LKLKTGIGAFLEEKVLKLRAVLSHEAVVQTPFQFV